MAWVVGHVGSRELFIFVKLDKVQNIPMPLGMIQQGGEN